MNNSPALAEKMQAVVRKRYGSVELAEIDRPVPDDDQVLVRVRAASLNRADWYGMAGLPLVGRISMGLRRPKTPGLGTDYAGEVVAVGKNVTGFRPGDRVFGGRDGALAQYVAARHDRGIAQMPANATFEQAAAVPVAALTALQGLRDKGGVQPGQRVLIQGASGGVGLFAVQIAKAFGAEVTAVCGPRGVTAARDSGADHIVDYTREDFTKSDRRFDLVFDIAGTRPFRHLKRVLTRGGAVVIVGGPKESRLLGPIAHLIAMRLGGLIGRRKVTFFVAKFNKADMEALRDLLAAGKLRPVIDRRFTLAETAEAFRYMGDGHPQGKVAVTVP
jgi:NADPH:quinone reductase-like Zn-dependent oxidoreductase